MHGLIDFASSSAIARNVPRNHTARRAETISANVLGVRVDALDLERAVLDIAARLESGPKGYVCAIGVHGILEAMRSRVVADALAHAAIALPDGTPTVWVGRLQGFCDMNHVTGPAIMQAIFSRAQFAHYSHFFYGGKPGVADDLASTLRRQFPWTKVAGTYTPPFRDLTSREESELISRLNELRPDIIWIGISTPRQDVFMQHILPHVNARIMFGVGAAFDFLTGRIRHCPEWVKRAGLHWLHRLIQDPAHLWRRNLSNSAFLWHIALQATRLRRYSLPSRIDDEALNPNSDAKEYSGSN